MRIGPTQRKVLDDLRPIDGTKPRRTVKEIAARTKLTVPQVSGAIDRLWERSYVRATGGYDHDMPGYLYDLTQTGEQRLAEIDEGS
jgi:DNA-binding MarR family transcriptional regulator